MTTPTVKHVDTIWGTHELPDVCNLIINTPMFQRLRYIEVMGPASWIIASANHTMYEHSIGTAILTQHWMNHLASLYDFITTDDILCATIASLTRNVGAMPWDSTFREFLVEKGARAHPKETFSGEMVFHMFSEGGILDKMDHHKYLIKALMKNNFAKGNEGGTQFDDRNLFMFCIVNSGRYPDAALIDRMLRDASRLGINHSINIYDIIDRSYIDRSKMLVIPVFVLKPLMGLREQIETLMAHNVTFASLKIMGKNAWKSTDIMVSATKTQKELMDITDLTFVTHPHFAFFHGDIVDKRFPIMVDEKHFETRDEVMDFIKHHPLQQNHQYHTSTIHKVTTGMYILREFLVT
jgi:hypothetical protein